MNSQSQPFPRPATIHLLSSPDWTDYELLDSGHGAKLERYGPYTFVRPEHQAIWSPALPKSEWQAAHATFQTTGGESGGNWEYHKKVKPTWVMNYKDIRFRAHTSGSRHVGVFPEQACHWDWIREQIKHAESASQKHSPQVLNLFGYTGLATLAAAKAGANVTHVDASKKVIQIGQENQKLSNLTQQPVRWLVDDAFKFVRREVRRGSRYDGIILDPPKFGRGPQGQVWEFFESLPSLLQDCRAILSEKPLFVVLTAYAIRASSLSIDYALQEMLASLGGRIESGEIILIEKSAERMLSTAIFARWSSQID
jgi:23S rRNA (cytosine1962-C5)-methyltransferase